MRRSSCVQYAICRQKPNSINAMSAGIMLKDLAIAGVLQPEAAQVLISIVQKEDNIGQSLGAVLQEAAPSLSKMVCFFTAMMYISVVLTVRA